jgi:hypothetical protein
MSTPVSLDEYLIEEHDMLPELFILEKSQDGNDVIFSQFGGAISHNECDDLIRRINNYKRIYKDESIRAYNDEMKKKYEKQYEKMMNDKSYKSVEKIRKTPGYFYILELYDKYKIGITSNLNIRIKSYHTHTPDHKLVYSIKCMNRLSIERAVQDEFDGDLYRNEWFDFTDINNVISFVESIAEKVA